MITVPATPRPIPASAPVLSPDCGAPDEGVDEAELLKLALLEGDVEDVKLDELGEVEVAGCLVAEMAPASIVVIRVPDA